MKEEYDNIITLTDEDGVKCSFEILDFVELDNNNYVILYPADVEDEAEARDVLILQMEFYKNGEDDTETDVSSIEDFEDEDLDVRLYNVEDDICAAVFEKFRDSFWEKYNFVDK